MSNSIFLLTSFVASIVLVWTGRFPQALTILTGIDIAAASPFFCASRTVFGRISQNLALLCIGLVSIDRFLITSRHEHYRRLLTKLRATLIVTILFLIYLAISIEDAISYYWARSCKSPNAPFAYTQFVSYFSWVVTFGVPLILIGIFSLLTWQNLRFSVHGRRNRLQQQVNRMMFAQFGLMFFSTLPIILMRVYRLVTESQKKSLLQNTQETLIFYVATTLGYTSPIGSFYIYFIVSPVFRQNVRTALICKRFTRVTPFTFREPRIGTNPT
ncbi:unnamed protein product [Rotaria sp. Silwood2]|nr:unnamed protein product [Rotaria sp. Silwood2]CAF4188600.1 unnamed protein product [Rotaria sp. Silwood2]